MNRFLKLMLSGIEPVINNEVTYEFYEDGTIQRCVHMGTHCGCGSYLRTRKEVKKHHKAFPNYSCFDHLDRIAK